MTSWGAPWPAWTREGCGGGGGVRGRGRGTQPTGGRRGQGPGAGGHTGAASTEPGWRRQWAAAWDGVRAWRPQPGLRRCRGGWRLGARERRGLGGVRRRCLRRRQGVRGPTESTRGCQVQAGRAQILLAQKAERLRGRRSWRAQGGWGWGRALRGSWVAAAPPTRRERRVLRHETAQQEGGSAFGTAGRARSTPQQHCKPLRSQAVKVKLVLGVSLAGEPHTDPPEDSAGSGSTPFWPRGTEPAAACNGGDMRRVAALPPAASPLDRTREGEKDGGRVVEGPPSGDVHSASPKGRWLSDASEGGSAGDQACAGPCTCCPSPCPRLPLGGGGHVERDSQDETCQGLPGRCTTGHSESHNGTGTAKNASSSGPSAPPTSAESSVWQGLSV